MTTFQNTAGAPVALKDLPVGSSVPERTLAPITRTQLALFAGASGDHNPIHLDDEEARCGGLTGVIAHGMLSMAFLGEFISRLAGQDNLRSFDARFNAMAFPGDEITCSGVVAAPDDADSDTVVCLDVAAKNQKGETIVSGTARIAVS